MKAMAIEKLACETLLLSLCFHNNLLNKNYKILTAYDSTAMGGDALRVIGSRKLGDKVGLNHTLIQLHED
ncbi:hypothetical protein T265_02850 [Opisthorchis viverrini]|uniref:Uncharacterized protein n=1 Tax=Opisthorchis viverrini TaxID=6198 RepID=A0A074ZXW4_OPIVI|nr:hypothetical protein T265_02850 [Opisthorchis viverrini]KER30812.1 hypothetical protein T265_02850 [Opisthorchis viverrini]